MAAELVPLGRALVTLARRRGVAPGLTLIGRDAVAQAQAARDTLVRGLLLSGADVRDLGSLDLETFVALEPTPLRVHVASDAGSEGLRIRCWIGADRLDDGALRVLLDLAAGDTFFAGGGTLTLADVRHHGTSSSRADGFEEDISTIAE